MHHSGEMGRKSVCRFHHHQYTVESPHWVFRQCGARVITHTSEKPRLNLNEHNEHTHTNWCGSRAHDIVDIIYDTGWQLSHRAHNTDLSRQSVGGGGGGDDDDDDDDGLELTEFWSPHYELLLVFWHVNLGPLNLLTMCRLLLLLERYWIHTHIPHNTMSTQVHNIEPVFNKYLN